MMHFDVKLVPVRERGEIVVYDIFVNDAWIGSRRTFEQAVAAQTRHKQLTTAK